MHGVRGAFADISSSSAGEVANSVSAAPSADGSRGGTTRPTEVFTISGTLPTAVATTGSPRASASATTMGWPS